MLKMNLSQEKTKDFIAGLIALIFVVTAGYLALNRFNKSNNHELGIGGESTVTDNNGGSSSVRTDGQNANGNASTNTSSWWVANDYKQGDIKSGNYTVATGDTLWEIAEAVYGDGSQWGKILSANAGSVGYLPNGSQALIYAGQTLMLP